MRGEKWRGEENRKGEEREERRGEDLLRHRIEQEKPNDYVRML